MSGFHPEPTRRRGYKSYAWYPAWRPPLPEFVNVYFPDKSRQARRVISLTLAVSGGARADASRRPLQWLVRRPFARRDHSMIRSARASNEGGIVRPSLLAGFILMMSSNLQQALCAVYAPSPPGRARPRGPTCRRRPAGPAPAPGQELAGRMEEQADARESAPTPGATGAFVPRRRKR
jgi:hypothetical protein